MENITKRSIQITKGPSGRAIAHPIDSALLAAMYEHITMERNASAQYFAMSLWFSEREFKGFSKYYENESLSEQKHASSFSRYLIARGQTVILENLAPPIQVFDSVEEIVRNSFQMEADVTTSLNQLYSMAERTSDVRTNVYLDPVIENQTKAEDEFAYLLGKVSFANNQPSALFIIDNELYDDD
tara:strand:+ start:3668 stop:4222 length:555 start_codon:yes stop_codon:yes gene_type:complete